MGQETSKGQRGWLLNWSALLKFPVRIPSQGQAWKDLSHVRQARAGVKAEH